MNSSTADLERPSLTALVTSAKFGDAAVSLASRISRASIDDQPAMFKLFDQTVQAVGADAGVMLSCMRDEDSVYSLRTLAACDQRWLNDYADLGWIECDPWLRHASQEADAIRLSELKLVTPRERAFVEQSRAYGFNSCVIAPATTALGGARYGVLVLGSAREGFFEDPAYADFRVVARMLASELHQWLVRFLRQELLNRSKLTASDIALLREEALGHSSKQISRQLGIGVTTIDNRFQRVMRKLNADNRNQAMRIAALYGLFG